jgi:HSP20 family molecular chaperone IbpA
MMLTTSLRPFHVLDSVLASELEDMFFDAVDSVLPSSSPSSPTMMMSGGKKKRAMLTSSAAVARGRHVQTKETSKGTLVKLNVPGLSKDDIQITLRGARPVVSKEDESKLSSISGAQLQNQEGVPTSMRIDFLQKGEQQQQQSLTIKLRRKATHDIENAKAVVADGILRVVVPKITLPVVPVPVVSRESVAERPSVDDSEVCLKFAVAGYGNKDISVELDAERERLKISGLLKDKSSQFERVVPVPRGLRAEHVTLCAVENGVLELRLRDPLAIEKRVVPVFSTSPPPLQSLPSPQAMEAQPMITGEEEKGEKKPEQEQQQQQQQPEEDNRVVLMKQECPGYSAKDIECFINVDRTIEAKRGNRGVKIGIPNTIDIDSIKAYCEHGIFQVIGQTAPVAEPLSSSLAVRAPSTEEGEKQKMIQQLEDMVEEEEEEEVHEEEEERDAVLVNKREGEEEAMKA